MVLLLQAIKRAGIEEDSQAQRKQTRWGPFFLCALFSSDTVLPRNLVGNEFLKYLHEASRTRRVLRMRSWDLDAIENLLNRLYTTNPEQDKDVQM